MYIGKNKSFRVVCWLREEKNFTLILFAVIWAAAAALLLLAAARVAGGSAVQSRRRVAVQTAEQTGSQRGADCRVQSRQGAAAGSCDGWIQRAAAGRSDRGEWQARSSLSGRILHCTAPAAASKEPRTTSGGRIQIQIAVLLLCFFNLRSGLQSPDNTSTPRHGY
jgi:hypothetical protein